MGTSRWPCRAVLLVSLILAPAALPAQNEAQPDSARLQQPIITAFVAERWRNSWALRITTAAGLNDLLLGLSCREPGITLITRDRDFRRLTRFVRGLGVLAP